MATKAYILIETAVGKTREVGSALKAISTIKTVDVVTGPYDIIAVAEARDLNAIGELVTSRVHVIAGVLRTVTCLSMAAT
ncbi:MAG: Lrp/AsnC ligand binding domain-containing protein [Chloroflexi bacterium]|nr:Lrp/AsnC ligand binding domain-containing protein [Chloroflexota bacterium]